MVEVMSKDIFERAPEVRQPVKASWKASCTKRWARKVGQGSLIIVSPGRCVNAHGTQLHP